MNRQFWAAGLLATLVASASAALAAAPVAFFESATYAGVGNVVSIQRVPVRTSTGAIIYKDVRINFNVDANGNMTVATGFPKISTSPILLTGRAVAGTYLNAVYKFKLDGPGIGLAGRTTWSITEFGSHCTFTAGWTSGPIAGHPEQKRLTDAKISYAGYSYGVVGKNSCFDDEVFHQGYLIGASASPTGVTLFSYSDTTGDHPSPTGQVSFTLCKTGC